MAEQLKGKVFKCENCGSLLSYDPASKKLKCSHCASMFDIKNIKAARELIYTESSETKYEPWGETKSFKCRVCGAEYVLNEYESASNCPFCNASNVAFIDDLPGIKPNGILPFLVTAEEAHTSYLNWVKKKYMAPFGFKKKAKKQEARGVYIPIFTFDAKTYSTYVIRYGRTYTKTVRVGNKTVTKTYTTWYTDSGYINKDFNDIQVEASTHITQKDLRGMDGFDTNNAYEYKNDFIAGFRAERYSASLDQSFEVAKGIAGSSIRSAILSRYSYDILDYCNVRTTYSDVTYKYVLAPIWAIEYKYKNKQYKCFINGRDKTAYGKAPVSVSKSIMIGLAIIAIGVLLWYMMSH